MVTPFQFHWSGLHNAYSHSSRGTERMVIQWKCLFLCLILTELQNSRKTITSSSNKTSHKPGIHLWEGGYISESCELQCLKTAMQAIWNWIWTFMGDVALFEAMNTKTQHGCPGDDLLLSSCLSTSEFPLLRLINWNW